MADFVVGKAHNSTVKASSKDALGVGMAISRTPQFQQAMANPILRDEFVSAIKFRQEKALANSDKQMFDVLGGLLNMVKASNSKAEVQTEKAITGTHFDTNNIFAV